MSNDVGADIKRRELTFGEVLGLDHGRARVVVRARSQREAAAYLTDVGVHAQHDGERIMVERTGVVSLGASFVKLDDRLRALDWRRQVPAEEVYFTAEVAEQACRRALREKAEALREEAARVEKAAGDPSIHRWEGEG